MNSKRDVVREYCKKYPKHSTASLAKLLLKKESLLFTSYDTARTHVRVVRGLMPDGGKRGKGRELKFGVVKAEGNFTRENPYGLPDSHEELRPPYILPKVNNNILILSDLHIPYHNIPAINCAIKYGIEQKVNTIFINGDLIDCHNLSRFQKDPRKRSQKDEFEATIQFLTVLRKTFPKAGIYYHLGNHDIRYQLWLQAHPEVFGDPFYELENRLGLNKFKVHLIDDKTITHCGITGKLALHHGHYIFKGAMSPVSPAKTIWDKMSMSMICGHTHKISEFTQIDGKGQVHTCWSSGSLCELLPDYTPMANKYAHGFAHAIIKDSGDFTLRNFRIDQGKIL